MVFQTVLETLVTGLFVLFVVEFAWPEIKTKLRENKKKKVWVIDDSAIDLMVYQSNLNLENFDVEYYKDMRWLALKIRIFRPAAVIVDYHLAEGLKGDEMFHYCEDLSVPCRIATGEEGEISGVDSKKIVRKRLDSSFYEEIKTFIRSEAA